MTSLLESILRDAAHTDKNRLTALKQWVGRLDANEQAQLVDLAEVIEDGPVLAHLLRELGQRPKLTCSPLLFKKLSSSRPEVRAAAIESLATLKVSEAGRKLPELLNDPEPNVRRVAAYAAGQLKTRDAIDALLNLSNDPDAGVRSAVLKSLTKLGAAGGISFAVAALDHTETQLAALAYLEKLGGAEQAEAVLKLTETSRVVAVLTKVVAVLTHWEQQASKGSDQRRRIRRAVSDVQGRTGLILRWHTTVPLSPDAASELVEQMRRSDASEVEAAASSRWKSKIAEGVSTPVRRSKFPRRGANILKVFFFADLLVAEPTDVQFLASSDGRLKVWLNSRPVFDREKSSRFRPESDRFNATLVEGLNRLLLRVSSVGKEARFSCSISHEKFQCRARKVDRACASKSRGRWKGTCRFL